MPRRIAIGLLLAVGVLLPAKVRPATSSSFIDLIPLPGYTGAPGPPTTFPAASATYPGGWATIAAETLAEIQIMDASGGDGSGSVEVQTRDCPTCGIYIQATCTNPPDQTVKTSRCNYSLADAYQVRLNVATYVSGTFRGVLRTKTVN